MVHTDRIKIHCSIMELEAWFLGMYSIFQKMNSSLTLEYIEHNLGFNLLEYDPKYFIHPTIQLNNILCLVNIQYDKSDDVVESLCSRITAEDVHNAFENGRCESFRQFYNEIMN